MKRLTFDGNFCDIARCVWPVKGGTYCKNGACSQRETWERLKAIEDILGDEYDLDRLRELVQADREGQCVVHSRWEECDYVEPCVHGFGTNRIKDAGMKCLNCVHVFKKELLWANNYCPNCGAKMSLGD